MLGAGRRPASVALIGVDMVGGFVCAPVVSQTKIDSCLYFFTWQDENAAAFHGRDCAASRTRAVTHERRSSQLT